MKPVLVLAMAFVAVLISSCAQTPPPSDAEIEANFRSHRADFESLVKAIYEQPQISRLSMDSINNKPDIIPENTDPKRADKIIATMRRLGVSTIGAGTPDGGLYVAFDVHSSGLGIAGTLKRIVYSERPLTDDKEVKDTDAALIESKGRGWVHVYKKIDTNWYITLSAN